MGDGPPWDTAWSNINLFLAETLRHQYDVKHIVRLECRGVPDTEDEYDITAEVLVKEPVRLHAIRKTLKGCKPKVQKSDQGTPKVIKFDPLDRYSGLTEEDKSLLITFNLLPLQRRIRFWQKYLAPHFK